MVGYVLAVLIDMHRKSEEWDIEVGLRNAYTQRGRAYVYEIEEKNVK